MSDASNSPDVAVLVSGGLDSAILCVELLKTGARVFPLYLRFGLRWEEVEVSYLRRFLEAVARPGLERLTMLDEPVAALYGHHWSLEGPEVPDADSPDEAVYLPGRNLLFLAKASVWCRVRNIERVALGCLGSNPFSDSTPEFFERMEDVANRALTGRLRVVRPFEGLGKTDVLRRGAHLPLELTFSCLRPVGGRHCGACNKCAERRKGFLEAEVPDPTDYAATTAPAS
jgi:7-cyano-7-deazaguanine synthase